MKKINEVRGIGKAQTEVFIYYFMKKNKLNKKEFIATVKDVYKRMLAK